MDALRHLMRKPTNADSLALTVFVFSVIYAVLWGSKVAIVAGIAFVMMVLGALPQQVSLAFLVGATVIVLLQCRRKFRGGYEGFDDGALDQDVNGCDMDDICDAGDVFDIEYDH